MGVEIVLHEHDLRDVGEVLVRQVFEDLRIIDGGMAICHLDMAPAFQRREHHEQVGRAVALVLIIITFGVPWLGWDRHPRLSDELLRGLVQADHGTIRIMRPVIDFQHVFHAGYECGVGIRRDDPLLIQVRLKAVFFSVRPIVLSLARATMFSSTTLSSSRRNVHLARPLGGSEQASAVSLASAAPSKMRGLAEAGESLRGQHRLEPFFDQLPTNPGDSHEAGVQRRSDLAVAPSFARLTCIGLQQDAGPGQLPRRVLATLDQGIKALSLFSTELHDILLYGNLFPGHELAPSLRYGAIDSDILPNVNDVAD